MDEEKQVFYKTSDISCSLGRSMDLTGHRYGHLTVLAFYDKKGPFPRWLCRCACGTECVKYGHQMRAGQTVSCGCEQRRKASRLGKLKAQSLTGKVFSRLTVIGREGSRYRKATWRCRCECGKETVVATSSLMSGNTTSCGCFHKEMVSDLFYNPNLSDEERAINRNRGVMIPGYHLWRKDVYARDGYACQVCGAFGNIVLAAHHMDGWEWCKDRRLDVANGVTACVGCHAKFHEEYGYGENTEAQWRLFVASKEVRCA